MAQPQGRVSAPGGVSAAAALLAANPCLPPFALQADIDTRWSEMDRAGTGAIGRSEYQACINQRAGAAISPADQRAAFAIVDANGDSRITRQEYLAVLSTPGLTAGLPQRPQQLGAAEPRQQQPRRQTQQSARVQQPVGAGNPCLPPFDAGVDPNAMWAQVQDQDSPGTGGWISTEEYRSCLSKRGEGGLNLTDRQMQAFAAVDSDRDGRITYDEFMRVVEAHRGPGQRMGQTGRTQ